MSLDYYNKNSKEYFERTVEVDMSHVQLKFLKLLTSASSILDVGCGSGRDSLFFIDQGYFVTSFDGSRQMCERSEELLGNKGDVTHSKFLDYKTNKLFDGIWASATLLHVPMCELKETIFHLQNFLKSGGIFYLSFKWGDEERIEGVRHFTDFTKDSFEDFIAEFKELEIVEILKTSSADSEKRELSWLNVFIKKH